jgi:hypothetical protein
MFIGLTLLPACALKVIPQPIEAGIINAADNSQRVTKGGIAITARVADTELSSYNLEGTVTAFSVQIDNQTSSEVPFDTNSFLLLDDQARQYFSLTPEKVKEMLSKDSYYLIPYPYVGFYYLEDYEKSSFYNTYNSQLPYFYEVYPQDIYTKALQSGSIIPKAKVAGLVYFKIDLNGKKGVKLLVYKKGTAKSAAPDFVFPFKIE